MLVDIIIPAYNPGTYLLEAVESCYKQSYQEISVTVIDDCSTQDLDFKKLKSKFPKVNLLRTSQNGGPAAARNYGIQHTNGALISFLDADDIMAKDKLLYSVKEFELDQDLGMTCGNYQILINRHKLRAPFYRTSPVINWQNLLINNYVASGSVTVRRRVLEDVGLFDERFWIGEDAELWLRLSEKYSIKYIPKVLYIYSICPGNQSLTQRTDIQKNHLRNLEIMRKESRARVAKRAESIEKHSHSKLSS